MNIFSSSAPTAAEVEREGRVKDQITANLRESLKALQRQHVNSDESIRSEDTANAVCCVLEAVFLHGLKAPVTKKSFWGLLQKMTHKNTLAQLNQLGQITTEVGMCRAWLRLALNDGVLESYLDAILSDHKTIRQYYNRTAYLRDNEHPGILRTYIQGLSNFSFELSYNSSVLNIWTHTPLILAGLVAPTSDPRPVISQTANSRPPVRPHSGHTYTAVGLQSTAVEAPGTQIPSGAPRRKKVRDKRPQSSTRHIASIGYAHQDTADLPSTPPNTPYDPSQLTAHDIEAIRKLASPGSGDDSGSTTTSQISQPDPVDARLLNDNLPKMIPDAKPSSSDQLVPDSDGMEVDESSQTEQDAVMDDSSKTAEPESSMISDLPEGASSSQQDVPQPSFSPVKSRDDFSHLNPFTKDYTGLSNPFLDDISAIAESSQTSSTNDNTIKASEFPRSKSESALKRRNADEVQVPSTDLQKQPDLPEGSALSSSPRTSLSQSSSFPKLALGKSPPLEPELSSATATSDRVEMGREALLGDSLTEGTAAAIEEEDDDIMDMDDLPAGNSLVGREGWSSDFETSCQSDRGFLVSDNYGGALTISVNESFDNMVHNYGSALGRVEAPTMSEVLDGLPSPSHQGMSFGSSSSSSDLPRLLRVPTLEEEVIDEYEVLPDLREKRAYLNEPRFQPLLDIMGTICTEKGLDMQNYQCKGCSRPIGMFYGKARVCTYDACYYCYECHESDEAYIPARIVFNWDFRKHRVCRQNLEFLTQSEDDPLMNIETLNPKLYDHVQEMAEVKNLRIQLRFLKAYLFTCKQSIADELRKQVWPREYYYDDIDVYSTNDLLQVATGQLAQTIKRVVKFASKHVYDCALCRQKGFICEICNASKVIYPFEMDSTLRCGQCKAVYHLDCWKKVSKCRKCERRQERRNRLGTTNISTPDHISDYAVSPDNDNLTV